MQSDDLSAEAADAGAVQAYLRARARGGPRVGPFSLLLSPGDRGLYGNYAIPDDGALPSLADVAALEEAFRACKRTPRLEYVPAAAPAVETALAAAGFAVELRPPLMTCRAGAAVPPTPAPDGVALAFATEPDALAEAAAVEAEAFGGEAAESQWLAGLPGRGGFVLVARDLAAGAVVGVGAALRPIEGVTEVVGIGVRPAFRRRGVAQAITASLAEHVLANGCTLAFLSAAGEAQSAIYARAGFVRRAPMLFISKLEPAM
jgi:ribosomal protein S18 acetylase RimI-like enzyme